MTTEIETWNARARWLQVALEPAREPDQEPQPGLLEQARAKLARWRRLLAQCPSRELRAAAHPPGLRGDGAGQHVHEHREGCLVLSSSVGAGKTTAMCWRAYHARGDVLWLDAVRIATARTEALNRWLDQVRSAALVLVDDVGAAGTSGQYESPRVAAILTAVAARREPSIVSTNLTADAFGRAYDERANGGRLRDRLHMRPNRWVQLPEVEQSRRVDAEPPPGEDVLPPREARALTFLRAVGTLATSSQAFVMEDVDQYAILAVARRYGLHSLTDLDRAVQEHAEARQRVLQAVACLSASMRLPVLPDEDEPDAPEEPPVPASVQRAHVLDRVAYVADQLGVEERDVMARIGRTRRTLAPQDEAAVLRLLGAELDV